MQLAVSKKQLSIGLQSLRKWMPQEHYATIGCDSAGCFVGVRLDASFVRIPVYADAINKGAVDLRYKLATKLVKNCESRDQIRFCEPSRPMALGREVEFSTRINGAVCDWVHPAASRASQVEIPLPENELDIDALRARVADGFGGEFALIPKWKRALAGWESCFHGETDDGRLLLSNGETIVVLAPSQAPKRKSVETLKPMTIEKPKHNNLCGNRALWSGAQSHTVHEY